MKVPHILLAASNVQKLRTNLAHVLDVANQQALQAEIEANVRALYALGTEHHTFAMGLADAHWRQVMSRLYYGAYNCVRAARFCDNGHYSTESGDHKKVADLPAGFPNAPTYSVQLPLLRDDRNICDYDHSAEEADLAISVADARALVTDLVTDARRFIVNKGIVL